MEERYYTSKELMEYFGVSRYSLYRAQKKGLLNVSRKQGTENLYSESEVKRYIENSGRN